MRLIWINCVDEFKIRVITFIFFIFSGAPEMTRKTITGWTLHVNASIARLQDFSTNFLFFFLIYNFMFWLSSFFIVAFHHFSFSINKNKETTLTMEHDFSFFTFFYISCFQRYSSIGFHFLHFWNTKKIFSVYFSNVPALWSTLNICILFLSCLCKIDHEY